MRRMNQPYRGVMLKTKSVTEPAAASDGLRILATRYRGRGLPTTAYDVWMGNLGPSERLLADVLEGRITWRESPRTMSPPL